MGGETEREESGWTVDTLNQHIREVVANLRREMDATLRMLNERYETQTKATDKAFEAQQMAMQTSLQTAERAVDKALASAEKAASKVEVSANDRFAATNEFRGQLQDQAAQFVSIAEFRAEIQRLSEKVDDIKTHIDKTEGRSGGYTAVYGWVVAALGIIISIVVVAATFGK